MVVADNLIAAGFVVVVAATAHQAMLVLKANASISDKGADGVRRYFVAPLNSWSTAVSGRAVFLRDPRSCPCPSSRQ